MTEQEFINQESNRFPDSFGLIGFHGRFEIRNDVSYERCGVAYLVIAEVDGEELCTCTPVELSRNYTI